jgi:NAD(P)-dependent dehydrogenase (short-subunit alcohol dehydrogenase family)
VVLAGRKIEGLEETAEMVRAAGRKALVVPTDVKVPEACEALAAAAKEAFGRIDFLVNNAGGSRAKTYDTWSLSDFDDMLALNLKSVWVLSRAAAAVMRDGGQGGAIVNISSGASLYPVPHSAPYGAAKAAVNNLTEVMAVDLSRWAIRVNCVAPGTIKSEGFVRAMDRMNLDPDVAGGANPVGRAGLPEEIAWPVLFLCSPAAGFINGQTLYAGAAQLSSLIVWMYWLVFMPEPPYSSGMVIPKRPIWRISSMISSGTRLAAITSSSAGTRRSRT